MPRRMEWYPDKKELVKALREAVFEAEEAVWEHIREAFPEADSEIPYSTRLLLARDIGNAVISWLQDSHGAGEFWSSLKVKGLFPDR